MATEIEYLRRLMPDDSYQRAVATRDDSKYADDSQEFLNAVNGQVVEVRDYSGNVIQSALSAGYLDEDIVFTGQNMSDAPSTNPGVMNITFTFLGNGECSAKVTWTINPEAGKSLRICYNTMGYKSVAEIEARTYRCGVPHLFLGYHMTGNGDDGQRSDATLNAHQIICIF